MIHRDPTARVISMYIKSNKTECKSQISVKVYPGLCAAAMKAGSDKELSFWYELRAINSSGSSDPGQQRSGSKVDLKEVLAALVPAVYSRSTFYRILKAGNGQFWHIYQASKPYNHSRIGIAGLYKVAVLLSVEHLSRPHEVSFSSFIGRKEKSAQLYSSFHKPVSFSNTRPISRDSLKVATGVPRRSQIRYDKIAGNKKAANFAFQNDSKGRSWPVLEFLKGKSKQYLTVRRLGNSYHSAAIAISRGMTKRVNSQLEQSLIKGEAMLPKRFFTTAKSLIKCQNKDPEPFLLVSPRNRLIKGRLEWCMA